MPRRARQSRKGGQGLRFRLWVHKTMLGLLSDIVLSCRCPTDLIMEITCPVTWFVCSAGHGDEQGPKDEAG